MSAARSALDLGAIRWAFGLFAAALPALVLAAASCSDAGGSFGAPPPAAARSGLCVDEDCDGFGEGCAAGTDCDDGDDTVTDECYRCRHPEPGCPCDVDGEHIACGKVESEVAGQLVCGRGTSVCEGGAWADCVINNAVTLAPPPGAPGSSTQGLGQAVKCVGNPCDPYCMDFPDTPSGLGSADAGIAASDAGLTLPGNDAGWTPPTCTGGVTASCPHSLCFTGSKLTSGCDNAAGQPALDCVAKICQANPSCCTTSWTAACVAAVTSVCGLECGSLSGTCVLCYKDAFDHDGDGYAYTQGDCRDCDPNVNPGAFDYPGNGVDEDCSGAADDQVLGCDANLAMASSQALDHAKAIGLCRSTTASATGAAKTWGVISAKLVQADGVKTPNASSYGILSKFGANNLPQEGSRMAVYSSGTARAPADSGWVNPNGQYGSYNQNQQCAYPTGFPKSKAGCPPGAGDQAFDSSGLWLQIRVPTNAKSFTYLFDFFTTEYPEWVCTAYDDSFVALLQTGYLPAIPAASSKNISFDSQGNPVSVNSGFFTVTSGPKLTGTGMDGTCAGQVCGGSTDWLQTTAPVVPGETITLQFAIWDTGDHAWDSIVLIDGFRWSVNAAALKTQPPAAPPATTFSDGWFVRDYDVSSVCPQGTGPVWGLWSWSASTPGDSSIDFSIQTAATAAGLAAAPKDALQFSNPPGPAALAGTAAVARTGPPNTLLGAAVVDTTLAAKGRARGLPFLRMTSHLAPSTDKLKAPVLGAWDLQVDCKPNQ